MTSFGATDMWSAINHVSCARADEAKAAQVSDQNINVERFMWMMAGHPDSMQRIQFGLHLIDFTLLA